MREDGSYHGRRNVQGKGRALAHPAFDINPAADQIHVFLDDVEAQSDAAMIDPCASALPLAKALKDRRPLLVGNTRTGIGDFNFQELSRAGVARRDRYAAALGKFKRVVNQVFQNMPELGSIDEQQRDIRRTVPDQLHIRFRPAVVGRFELGHKLPEIGVARFDL